jgi:hypothetical protein
MNDMELHHVREEIRAAIIEGSLPRSGGHPRIFGGRGDGQACVCCHEIIKLTDTQYDIDCTLKEVIHTLSMHMSCFQVWVMESRALADMAGHTVCEDAA